MLSLAEIVLMTMNKQKEYWDKKIKIWSNSSYRKGKVINSIERLAGFFRRPIIGRMEEALKIVGPRSRGEIVADLGCGVGDFCFAILTYQPRKVIGIDLSLVAVKEAQKRAKKEGENKVEFIQADLGRMDTLPEFDIAVGLGFIDYLNREELTRLFKQLKDRYFFFSFPEKKFSLINLLQAVYLKTQKCPGAYKYTKEEMHKIIPKDLNFYFLTEGKMVFITNLPK